MKIRHPKLLKLVATLAAVVIRVALATLRPRVASLDRRTHPTDPAEGRNIYAFWHESLLAPASRPGKVNVLISLHADGELIAQVCRRLGIGVVRGSTKRRGGPAILEMLSSGEDAHLAITPDGPRGPRRQVQMGVVFLASHAGLPIVPIGIGFSHVWRAKSWDRFAVPLPFSRVHAVVGKPLVVPPDLPRPAMEEYRLKLEAEMLALTAAAEAWACNPMRDPLALDHLPHCASAAVRAA
jgi:lysophospholipid acyltransferase (LPLAT)-like uncharacterized protein